MQKYCVTSFNNIDPNATFKIVIKDGFKITEGHPTFNKTMTEPDNVQAFAAAIIKHNYRSDWTLPSMP
jgi:hypothetical protein